MSQSLTQLKGVPRTMLLTTRARVEEHQRDDGLFRDPQAFAWWQSMTWDSALDELWSPLSQLTWAVRAHTFDQMVIKHLASHPHSVVVELGCGLSTRFYRVGESCKNWLDLDLPDVINLRQQLDHETEQHRLIAQSALDFSWMDRVPDCPPESLLILAEGLLMYFTFEQVQQLIQQLRQRFPNATLMFEIVGGASKGKAAKVLKKLGAPMQWLVKDERDLNDMGLAIAQVFSLVQENCRYPHRIGALRWISWITKLPSIRNASLLLQAKLI